VVGSGISKCLASRSSGIVLMFHSHQRGTGFPITWKAVLIDDSSRSSDGPVEHSDQRRRRERLQVCSCAWSQAVDVRRAMSCST